MNNTFYKLRVVHIVAVVIIGFSLVTTITAQTKPAYDDKLLFKGMTGVTMGGIQQQWTIKDSGTLAQQSAPLYVSIPIANRILLSISSAAAMAKYDTSKLNGIADTRLSVSYVLPGDKVWLLGGVNIPTGKTKLTANEMQVSSMLSQTSFATRVPVYGQGINANLGITYATSLTRRFILGFGASMFYKGKYEPVSAGTAKYFYDPGDEISANVGADYITFSKTYRFSFDLNGTYFLNDKLNEKNIVHSGPRIIGMFVMSTKTESFNHIVQLRSRLRGNNLYYKKDTAGVEYTEKLKSAIQIEAQYSVSRALSNWLFTTGIVEIKTFTEDRFPAGTEIIKTGKAFLASLGAEGVFTFSQIIIPTLSVKYGKGNLLLNNKQYNISGIEAGLSIRVMF